MKITIHSGPDVRVFMFNVPPAAKVMHILGHIRGLKSGLMTGEVRD